MRFMMKVTLPVEAGNDLIRDPNLGSRMQSIMEDLKPEAAYFAPTDGQRTMYLIVNMDDSARIPSLVEPLWLSLKANVDIIPVMNQDDFNWAMPGIEQLVKKY